MARGLGNLLLTIDGLETSHIPEKDRENAVSEFYRMKMNAESKKDRFYALAAVYNYTFSYGKFYPNFYNMNWNEFQACDSLKGIGQRVYQLMQGFCKFPNQVETLDEEKAFMEKDPPRVHTGYSNPKKYKEYVGCITEWEEWHRKWYANHPLDIDWTASTNDWLPRHDLILCILKRELFAKFKEEENDIEDAKNKLNKIEDEHIVNEFHDKVMGHKGSELASYALKIGNEICSCNYYTHEKELTNLEQKKANSLRKIYSIINKDGRRQFISIDCRHGMFEFHNENGEHQGEFRFDGSFNSEPETDHGFKCMKEWRKMTGK